MMQQGSLKKKGVYHINRSSLKKIRFDEDDYDDKKENLHEVTL